MARSLNQTVLMVCDLGASYFEKRLAVERIGDDQKKALDDSLTSYLVSQDVPLDPKNIYLLTLATICVSIAEDAPDQTPALEKMEEKRGRGRPPGSKNKQATIKDAVTAKPKPNSKGSTTKK